MDNNSTANTPSAGSGPAAPAKATKDQITLSLDAAKSAADALAAFTKTLGAAPDLAFLVPVVQGASDRLGEATRYLNDKLATVK